MIGLIIYLMGVLIEVGTKIFSQLVPSPGLLAIFIFLEIMIVVLIIPLGVIVGILQWFRRAAPIFYKGAKSFFIKQYEMPQRFASVYAFIVTSGVAIVII